MERTLIRTPPFLSLVVFALPFVVLGLPACDFGPTPEYGGYNLTVNGTIGGQEIGFVDVGGFVGEGAGPSGAMSFATIYLTTKGPACGWLDNSNAMRADLVTLQFRVVNTSVGGAAPSVPLGTYTLGGTTSPDGGESQTVEASLLVSTVSCDDNKSAIGQSGAVTFLTLSAAEIAGSFDIVLSTGDRLTGTFDAPLCTASSSDAADAGSCHF